MLDRCRDFVQHPNQPRLMATEATDEDDEEGTLSTTSPIPLTMGGRPLEGAPCLCFSCWLLVPFPPIGGVAKN